MTTFTKMQKGNMFYYLFCQKIKMNDFFAVFQLLQCNELEVENKFCNFYFCDNESAVYKQQYFGSESGEMTFI